MSHGEVGVGEEKQLDGKEMYVLDIIVKKHRTDDVRHENKWSKNEIVQTHHERRGGRSSVDIANERTKKNKGSWTMNSIIPGWENNKRN